MLHTVQVGDWLEGHSALCLSPCCCRVGGVNDDVGMLHGTTRRQAAPQPWWRWCCLAPAGRCQGVIIRLLALCAAKHSSRVYMCIAAM